MPDVFASAQSPDGFLELIHAGRKVCIRISSFETEVDSERVEAVHMEFVYLDANEARKIGTRLIEWADRFS